MTDPDKYRMILQTVRVRVLRYHDRPGAKTRPHYHPASVLYALSSFRRRLIFADGTVKERSFKRGDVMWIPAQTHTGENIGKTNTEVLLIELLDGPVVVEKPLRAHSARVAPRIRGVDRKQRLPSKPEGNAP